MTEGDVKKQVVEELLGSLDDATGTFVDAVRRLTELCNVLGIESTCILSQQCGLPHHLLEHEKNMLSLSGRKDLMKEQAFLFTEIMEEKNRIKSITQEGKTRLLDNKQIIAPKLKSLNEELKEVSAEALDCKKKLKRIGFEENLSDSKIQEKEDRVAQFQSQLNRLQKESRSFDGLQPQSSDIIQRIRELKVEHDNLECQFRDLDISRL